MQSTIYLRLLRTAAAAIFHAAPYALKMYCFVWQGKRGGGTQWMWFSVCIFSFPLGWWWRVKNKSRLYILPPSPVEEHGPEGQEEWWPQARPGSLLSSLWHTMMRLCLLSFSLRWLIALLAALVSHVVEAFFCGAFYCWSWKIWSQITLCCFCIWMSSFFLCSAFVDIETLMQFKWRVTIYHEDKK